MRLRRLESGDVRGNLLVQVLGGSGKDFYADVRRGLPGQDQSGRFKRQVGQVKFWSATRRFTRVNGFALRFANRFCRVFSHTSFVLGDIAHRGLGPTAATPA